MLKMRHGFSMLATLALVAGSACSDGSNAPFTGGTQVLLTDAPFPYEDVARVDVFINSVEANASADTIGGIDQGWVSIATPMRAFNLLELQRGATALLGDAELPAGQYQAIRMTIDPSQSSITMADGSEASVRWPGSGLITLHALVEDPLATGPGARIVIDFDVGRSFLVLESFPQQFVFSAWIRAVNEAGTGELSGAVHWSNSIEGDAGFGGQAGPLANASITVYRGHPSNSNAWWVAATGTTDANGNYHIAFLRQGTYHVRVSGTTPEGYGCSQFVDHDVTVGTTTTLNMIVFPHDGCVDPDPDPNDTTGVDSTQTPPPGGPVATVTVHAWAPPAGIAVGDSVGAGADLKNAEGAILSGRVVTWSISDPTVFSLTQYGHQWATLRALKAGTATLTATSEGQSGAVQLTAN